MLEGSEKRYCLGAAAGVDDIDTAAGTADADGTAKPPLKPDANPKLIAPVEVADLVDGFKTA